MRFWEPQEIHQFRFSESPPQLFFQRAFRVIAVVPPDLDGHEGEVLEPYDDIFDGAVIGRNLSLIFEYGHRYEPLRSVIRCTKLSVLSGNASRSTVYSMVFV